MKAGKSTSSGRCESYRLYGAVIWIVRDSLSPIDSPLKQSASRAAKMLLFLPPQCFAVVTILVPTVVLAAPSFSISTSDLRLVKTAYSEPARWMSENEKLTLRHQRGPGFIDITDTLELETSVAEGTFRHATPNYPAGALHQNETAPYLQKLKITNLEAWANQMSGFFTRYYRSRDGTKAGQWMFDTVKHVANGNPAITVNPWKHRYNQPSVIAQIPGVKGAGTVIVSAHYDSIGTTPNGRAPGKRITVPKNDPNLMHHGVRGR